MNINRTIILGGLITCAMGCGTNLKESTIADGTQAQADPLSGKPPLGAFGFQSMLRYWVNPSAGDSSPAHSTRPTLLIVASFADTSACPSKSKGPFPGKLTHPTSYYENLVFGPTAPNINGWLNAQSGGQASLRKVRTVELNNVPGRWDVDAVDGSVVGNLLVLASQQFNFADFDTNSDGVVAHQELNVIVVSNFHVRCQDGASGANRWPPTAAGSRPVVNGKEWLGAVAEFEENVAFSTATHEELHSWGALDIYTGGCSGGNSLMGGVSDGPDSTFSFAVDSLHKFLLGWTVPSIYDFSLLSSVTISLDAGPALIYESTHGTLEYALVERRKVGPYQANTSEGVMAFPVLLGSDFIPPDINAFMPNYLYGATPVTVKWMASSTPAFTYSVGSDGLVTITRLPPHATPRSVGAFAGNPLDGSSSTCFSESSGAVKGTGAAGCVGKPWQNSPRWEINLPIDRAGSWTVSVGIRGNGVSGPTCRAYGWDQLTSSFSPSAAATNSSALFVVKSIQVPNVPSGGYLLLACDQLVDSSSAIGSINWTQP